MEIRPAMKVLHGNPVREYYVLKVEDRNALLTPTDSKSYNSGVHYQKEKCKCGRDKPYYPYWASFDELYVNASEAK